MIEMLIYVGCGLSAGLLGGYLGLGGGIIMVPFLTVISGLDIKEAVPVSLTAIAVNSLAASNEYLKRGMVDLELVIMLSLFMVLGNISGSLLSSLVPEDYTRILFSALVLYAVFSFLKGRSSSDKMTYQDNRGKYLIICTVLVFFTGVLAGMVGVGGGVILVPVLYLIIGLPLTTSRGTTSLMIGFSAAASALVYFMLGHLNLQVATGVIMGILIGAKLGGYLGTMAKPKVVKILFVIIMLYLAYKLSYQPIMELL
jgi:uncharacterized membrane protein YfcA